MTVKRRIFLTGTYRSGGNFLCNRLNAYPQLFVPGDLFHFFRFVYAQHSPLDGEAIAALAQAFCRRIEQRVGLRPEVSPERCENCPPSYASVYDLLADSLIALDPEAEPHTFGEKTAQDWNHIPDFLELFPGGRTIHLYRDPRAVLASWKKVTIQPHPLYLDAIFNCLDSLRKIQRFRRELPRDRYLPVRYEALVQNPSEQMERILSFLELPFEEALLTADLPSKLKRDLDGTFSTHGRGLRPFSPVSLDRWKQELAPWELAAIEHIAGPEMEAFGYRLSGEAAGERELRRYSEAMGSHPYLAGQWQRFEAGEDCRAGYPNDPRKAENWGPRGR